MRAVRRLASRATPTAARYLGTGATILDGSRNILSGEAADLRASTKRLPDNLVVRSASLTLSSPPRCKNANSTLPPPPPPPLASSRLLSLHLSPPSARSITMRTAATQRRWWPRSRSFSCRERLRSVTAEAAHWVTRWSTSSSQRRSIRTPLTARTAAFATRWTRRGTATATTDRTTLYCAAY